jgi:hypothetical protein
LRDRKAADLLQLSGCYLVRIAVSMSEIVAELRQLAEPSTPVSIDEP